MRKRTLLCAAALIAGCADPSPSVATQQIAIVYPPGVPAGYVPTPNGFFDPDCVIEVADGDVINDDATITSTDGSVRTIPTCPSPHYNALGNVIDDTSDAGPDSSL